MAENPVINSPFSEPVGHFEVGERGIAGVINEARRPSSYFVPIGHARHQTAQLSLEAEWTKGRLRDTELVNRIREKVATWRRGGHAVVTTTTARLLQVANLMEQNEKLRTAHDLLLPRLMSGEIAV